MAVAAAQQHFGCRTLPFAMTSAGLDGYHFITTRGRRISPVADGLRLARDCRDTGQQPISIAGGLAVFDPLHQPPKAAGSQSRSVSGCRTGTGGILLPVWVGKIFTGRARTSLPNIHWRSSNVTVTAVFLQAPSIIYCCRCFRQQRPMISLIGAAAGAAGLHDGSGRLTAKILRRGQDAAHAARQTPPPIPAVCVVTGHGQPQCPVSACVGHRDLRSSICRFWPRTSFYHCRSRQL